MVYQIEVAINLKKVTNLTEIKNILLEKADECKLEDYYTMYEHIGKNRQIYRNHCVIVFFFTENDELLADFIRYTKNIKNISIECVGLDQGKFDFVVPLTTKRNDPINFDQHLKWWKKFKFN